MAVIAFDLGGTKLASALFTDEGEIIISEFSAIGKAKGKEVSNLILQKANDFLQKAQKENIEIKALGICVPGIAYVNTGKVWVPNISGWIDYPLLDELQQGISDKSLSIKIDSDRTCYILGEMWKGNAKNCSDAIFLSVGTGIGAGILSNNQIIRGAGNIAGAIGWMALSIPFQEKFIPCGCFEYNASGEGIAKVAGELLANKKEPYKEKNEAITAKDIFAGYEKGDQLSITVINNAIQYWGMAVANLVSIFNPQKIIFGGGVFGPALQFLSAIHNEAKKWAQPISMQQVKLEGSALGSQAGLYGAGYLALNETINR